MDNSIVRKRLQTYKSSEGRLRSVSDEVIIDVLRAWENWSGSTADLYRELDLTKMQMATLIKKAKKLVKNGLVTESEFHEVSGEGAESPPLSGSSSGAIEVSWQNGKVIRFNAVDQLVDFLNKVA